MSSINVFSEIGKLKKVMLHRPGNEVENLTPDYLERLLFDDIPYLKIAAQEHDGFAKILKENGAEVFYLEEMLMQVLENPEIKSEYIDELLLESNVFSEGLRRALKEYMLNKPVNEMIDDVFSGIRKHAIKEYEGSSLSDILKNDYQFYIDPMPNLYFTRDPAAAIGNGLTINTMHTIARRRETLCFKYIHKYHKMFADSETPLWHHRNNPYAIEGGDELVISDKVLAIGCSERTTPEAIEGVARALFEANTSFETVLVMEIQKRRAYMHLDTVFTMIDYDKFTIHPGIEQDLNVYEISKSDNKNLKFKYLSDPFKKIMEKALGVSCIELIKCGNGDVIVSSREQWNDGSNTLAIAPGVVITYERNYISNNLLAQKGIKVLEMAGSELSRGRGGPRCMSMPLYREKI